LQSCDHVANLARSDTGKAVICGGGSMLTGAGFYFSCHELISKKNGCITMAAVATLADAYACWLQLSEKIVEDYDLTAETLNYNPIQGTVLKIIDFSAHPKIAYPGEKVYIKVVYALLSPNPTDEIKYERNITVPGENKPRKVLLTHQPGTWGTEDDYVLEVEEDSPEGKIEMALEIKLLNSNISDRRTLCFNITHQSRPDPAQLCRPEAETTAPKNKVLVISNVKEYAVICRRADNRCKSRKSKNFIGTAFLNEQFPIIEEQRVGSTAWYKIQLKNGRNGWVRKSYGTILE
jgi:hypothetical protein